MNTKGIKFLAVLAVLTMAFAAFAVAVPSEETSATITTDATYISPDATAVDTGIIDGTSDNSLTDQEMLKYYVTGTVTITSCTTSAFVIYANVETVLTITSVGDSGTLTVIPVTANDTTKKLTQVGSSITFSAASNLQCTVSSDGKTMTFVGSASSSSGTISAGTIPVENTVTIGSTNAPTITVAGTLTVNGTLNNNAAATTAKAIQAGYLKISGDGAKITGTGTIAGTAVNLVNVDKGTLENVTVSQKSWTVNSGTRLLGVYGPSGNVTISGITVELQLVDDDSTEDKGTHGIGVYDVPTGTTVEVKNIKFTSVSDAATEVEFLVCAMKTTDGDFAGTAKFSGITIADKISIKEGYGQFMANGISNLGDVATGEEVTIDNSITLVRIAGDCTVTGDFETGNVVFKEGASITVAAAGELSADVELAESIPIKLAHSATKGGAFTGTVSYTSGGATSTAAISLRAGASTSNDDYLQIAPGSITVAGVIDSTYPGSAIVQTLGTVTIGTAATATSVTGAGVLGIGGKVNVANDLTIDAAVSGTGTTVYTVEDSVITIADGKKIIVNEMGIFSVDGTVKATSATGTGAIDNNGVVKESANSTVTVTITNIGKGTVVDEGDMEEIEVTGTSIQQTSFPAYQTVIVKDSWTLGTGTTPKTCAEITINGKLIVPAGATLTIKAGAVLKIDSDAKFIIEGTLVVEDGDIIGDDTFNAGKIEINNGTMTVSGTVSDNGWIAVANTMDVIVEPLGSFVIEDSGKLTTGSEATFVVSAGAELKIKGDFGNAEVYNFGYVLVDSEFPATTASAVYQMYDGATVEVKEYTIDAFYYNDAKLTISDYGMILFEYRADKEDKTFVRNENSETVVISMSQLDAAVTAANTYTISFSGLKVVSNVTTKASTTEKDVDNRIYNYVQYDKEMDIQGNLNVSYAYIGNSTSEATYEPKATVAVGGSILVVTEDINIYDGVTFNVISGGAITVTGDIDTSSSDATFAANAEASVTVKGEGSISSTGAAVSSEAGMNAAKIVIPVADLTGKIVKIYTYLSVDAALDYINADGSEITEAVVLGNQTLTVTNYVDAGDSLIVNGALTIGKKGTIDVVLTIKNGAKLKGTGSVAVNGTLYAENKTNVSITAAKIISDVYACEKNEAGKEVGNGWAMWTNIATAIAEAEIGETVTLIKEEAKLYSNLLIPSYVIVDVPNGKTLILDDGVTLTIDGVLMVEGDVKAQTAFDLVAKKITTGTKAYSSTIVVNGVLMTTGTVVYNDGKVGGTSGTGKSIYHADGAPIAGAYYSVKKYNVISDLSDAFENVDSILDDIVLNGKIVEGDLVFDASKNCVKITLSGALHKDASNNTIVNSLTVDSITLVDGAALVIDAATNVDNNVFTGKVIIDETAVAVTGLTTKGTDAGDNVEFKANLSGVFGISGKASITDKGDAITVSSGLVNLNGFTVDQATSGVKIVAENANYKYTTNFTVSADALVNSNNATNTIVNMIVDGTVTVPAGMGLTVTNITVKGSVIVANATATAPIGNLVIGQKQTVYDTTTPTYLYGKAYFGTAGKISDAAVLSGPFTPYVEGTDGGLIMYIYAGAETDAAADAVLDEMYSTELYADGALWATLYSTIYENKETVSVSVDDAEFVGWNASATKTTGSKDVTIGTNAKMYAIINYNIYKVTIYTDAGVKSVSIDGIELKNDQTNIFSTVVGLVAGTHTVTYTMKEGYEGTPTLATMTGTVLKDNKFAASGTTDADKKLSFQLMGTEPQPEPEPVTPEEKSEWTVTTILLCVLVVLIAIMAVIVALRLNRN